MSRSADRRTPPAIRFRAVEVAYGGDTALCGLDGEIAPGSLTALIGPNGAGKSTLLKAIAGLIRPRHGEIAFSDGAEPPIAYLPQSATLDREFPISVGDLAGFGLWQRGRVPGRAAAIDAALAAVGLSGTAGQPLASLSGGQFQRALLARLLLQDAPVILLDEPFASVDAATETMILALIRRWHDEGRTVIAALHDIGHVRDHFPRTMLLDRTPIAWGATRDVLAAHPEVAAEAPAVPRLRRAAA